MSYAQFAAPSQSPIERVSFVTRSWSGDQRMVEKSQSPIERVSFVTPDVRERMMREMRVAIPYRTGLICHVATGYKVDGKWERRNPL